MAKALRWRWLALALLVLVLVVVGARTGHLRLVITSTDLGNLARLAGAVAALVSAATFGGRQMRRAARRQAARRRRAREVAEAREARLAYLEELTRALNQDPPPP